VYVFRRWSEVGDAAVMDLQPARYSPPDETHFFVNTALFLAPVWRWRNTRQGLRHGIRPGTVDGITHNRILPPGDSDDWIVRATDASEVLEILLTQMGPWSSLVPQPLDHEQLETLTQDRKTFGHGASNVAAWLLAEEAGGATDELRRALFGDRDPSQSATGGTVPMAHPIWAWARSGEPWSNPPLTVEPGYPGTNRKSFWRGR
jgi:hypothetical protein